MRTGIALFSVLVLLLASCAEETRTPLFDAGDKDGGNLSIGQIEAAIDSSVVKSFRIRVYPATPVADTDSTLFDSYEAYGCFPSKGKDITIENLKTGEGRFIYYQGYSDKLCQDLSVVGIRGGITVEKKSAIQKIAEDTPCTEDANCRGVHPYALCDCDKELDNAGKKTDMCVASSQGNCSVNTPVYVMPLQVGKFNAFPSIPDALLNKMAAISCDSDLACQEIHGNGVCDLDRERCTVKGLAPLGPATTRAFHGMTVLDSGRILIVGGFTRKGMAGTKQVFRADSPFMEVFDPYTFQFTSVPVGALPEGNNVAMHSLVNLGGEKAAVFGGVTEAAMDVNRAGQNELRIGLPLTVSDDFCNGEDCNNASHYVSVFDLAGNGLAKKNPLDAGFLFSKAGLFAGEVIFSGGINFASDSSASAYGKFQRCTLSTGVTVTCTEDQSDLFAARFGHGDLCLTDPAGEDACSEYMLLGGTDAANTSGEVFSSNGGFTHNDLEFVDKTDLQGARFTTLLKVKDDDQNRPNIFAFGGTNNVSDPLPDGPDAVRVDVYPPALGPAPQQVKVNLQEGKLTVADLDLSDLDGDSPERKTFRVFNASVVLENGDIMETGGLDGEGKSSNQVIFFHDPNVGTLQVLGEMTMNAERFGHSMIVIKHGLLAGAVLIVGGLTADADGVVDFAPHAEVYLPVK